MPMNPSSLLMLGILLPLGILCLSEFRPPRWLWGIIGLVTLGVILYVLHTNCKSCQRRAARVRHQLAQLALRYAE